MSTDLECNNSESLEKFTNACLELPKISKDKKRHPRLVLSVIGDSNSFVPKPWLTPVLQLGLIETAIGAKDCVIIYKGSEEKVSSLVWEAVDDFRVMNNDGSSAQVYDSTFITLIGLRPDHDGHDGKEMSRPGHDCKCVTSQYFKLGNISNEETSRKYGEFHARALTNIAKEYVPFVGELNLTMKVPVLVIVAEGDMSTLDMIVQVLKEEIPVLVLQGSGKAADLIAECIDDLDSVEMKAPLLFGVFFRDSDLNNLKGLMNQINKYKNFVNVFDVTQHDESEFSTAVVNSIIRAWAQGGKNTNERPVKSARTGSRYVKTLPEEDNLDQIVQDIYNEIRGETPEPVRVSYGNNLQVNGHPGNGTTHRNKRKNSIQPSTVTLNAMNVSIAEVNNFMDTYQKSLTPASLPLYFYIAYQFIQEMPKEDRTENFQILLKQAIIANRVDYVSVLLQEEKVEFDRKQIPDIYQVICCDCDLEGDCQHIKSILKGASFNAAESLLKHRTSKKEKEKKEKKKKDINYQKNIQAGRQLCQKFLHYPRQSYVKNHLREKEEEDKRIKQRQELYHDLLIWSLFANRPELATLFWIKCENQLLTAILACCVLKRMATGAKSGKDRFLYESLKDHSSAFEKRAIDLQTKLYEEDPDVAMELMLTNFTVWDITVSPLECAFDNAMLDFIAHSCAQRRLNQLWYKRIGASLGEFWKNGFFCGCKRKTKASKEKCCEVPFFTFIYAPLTRFVVHYVIFLAAMVWYSAFLLIELSEYKGLESINIYEWLIYVWLLGDIIEEYRGILPWNYETIKSKFTKSNKDGSAKQSSMYRIRRFFYDFWNALDFLFYCVTIAAVLVRFLYTDPTVALARRLYSLSLFAMYMRILHAVLLSRKLGPKIIMIKEMLKDLFRFIGILFIFMIGVGVLYHANMYPAHYDMWNINGWTYWRIWKIIYIPYWQIYGDLFLDTFEANSTTPCTTIQSEWESNGEVERCNQYDWVLIVIAALYMLISNLLLVNLVIALFSYRFEMVQANSERLWRYWRYAVIMDYRTRVPAPLNLVLRPFMTIYKCIKRCAEKREKGDEKVINRMERLQAISANKCIRAVKLQPDSY